METGAQYNVTDCQTVQVLKLDSVEKQNLSDDCHKSTIKQQLASCPVITQMCNHSQMIGLHEASKQKINQEVSLMTINALELRKYC